MIASCDHFSRDRQHGTPLKRPPKLCGLHPAKIIIHPVGDKKLGVRLQVEYTVQVKVGTGAFGKVVLQRREVERSFLCQFGRLHFDVAVGSVHVFGKNVEAKASGMCGVCDQNPGY